MERMVSLVFSFLTILTIFIVYFSKPRLNNIENILYRAIVITCLLESIGSFGMIAVIYTGEVVRAIVYKVYSVIMANMTTMLFAYTYTVTVEKKVSEKAIKWGCIAATFTVGFVLLFLPMYTDATPADGIEGYCTYGPACDLIAIYGLVAIIAGIILMLTHIKKENMIKYIPLWVLVLMGAAMVVMRAVDISVVIQNPGYVLIVLIMFFTIENPDVKMLEELRFEKDRADKANKAKSDFLANMSHEIRTPINAILGMNTIVMRKSKDKEVLDFSKDIKSAGKNLLSIVNTILDFSKIESGKMEIVPVEYDFASLVNDVFEMTDVKVREKDLAFALKVDESIPCRCIGDDIRIRQILINLLTNAVKYTPSGSVSLEIKKNFEEKDEKSSGKNVSLHFEVRDTGIGIKPEDLDKLTEKFVRIEESRNRNIEGTGLGINIVVGLLSMMNSKLQVDSVYGEGSTFGFDLVQGVSDEEPIGNLETRFENLPEDSDIHMSSFIIPDVRLLVVDDNAMNRRVFKNLLLDMECDIDEAESGMECLKLVRENKYDIIFMDHMMPEMDGIETLHHMKEFGEYINSATPVIVLTANAIKGSMEKYLNEGFDGYLSKPIDVGKLENTIDKLIPDDRKKEAEKQIEQRIDLKDIAGLVETMPYIDGIDWYGAISRTKSKELLLDIIENTLMMSDKDIEECKNLFMALGTDADSINAFEIKAHSMKTTAGTIGAMHVAGLAKYLEYASKDENLEEIKQLFPIFLREWNKLISELKAAFKASESEKKKEKPGKNELFGFLDSLKEEMERADVNKSDDIVKELEKYRFEGEEAELFEELKIGVMSLDDEEVDSVIDKWKGLQ